MLNSRTASRRNSKLEDRSIEIMHLRTKKNKTRKTDTALEKCGLHLAC